jgi:nucleoside-diphosphate-sugar epimerase
MQTRHPLQEDLDCVMSHAQGVLQGLREKEVFISGGTGFFGKWLLESLVWADAKLGLGTTAHVLSRDPDAFRGRYPRLANAPQIKLHKGDVREFDFPLDRVDFVVHAATDASSPLNEHDPLLMLDTIVAGTRRMLDFASRAKARRFLLTSSGAVYGEQPPGLSHVPESYVGGPVPSEPASAYAEGKRVSELLCSIYQRHHGVEAVIARCFAFVGPYMELNAHYAVGNFIRDGLAGGPIRVTGDGTPYRSYLYVADLAVWLWTLLLQGQPGRAYNVGSDEPITVGDLARRVSGCLPGHPEVVVAQAAAADRPASRYVPCTDLARRELGLQCWTGLDEGLRRTIQFHARRSMKVRP